MYKLYPYFTNDGSVGLYNPIDDDIYHSTYGALTEAYEKFILPCDINEFIKYNSEIKILDICFGIGYNTKCFLDYFFKLKKSSIGAIDTNNILCNKVFIKAVDVDKNLAFLSPFFITDKKITEKNKINFNHEKISKLLNKKVYKKYKLNKEVNIVLLRKLLETKHLIFMDQEFQKILNEKAYSSYFDKYMINLFKYYKKFGYCKTPKGGLSTFLHNIYYRYISKRYKKALNCLKSNNIHMELKIEDARKAIIADNNVYDYIFLDAFTPAKCPSLWTLEFFKLLNRKITDSGMLLTYSNSAAVRKAMIEAGFYVGKIYNASSNKYLGTIGSKSLEKIKHGLTEYDLGLLNTKAGIIYRDEKLSLSNEAILSAHAKTVEQSTLQSSSKYIRENKGEE